MCKRELYLENIKKLCCCLLGIEDVNIEKDKFSGLPVLGAYSDKKRTVFINETIMKECMNANEEEWYNMSLLLVGILAHEIRHSFQYSNMSELWSEEIKKAEDMDFISNNIQDYLKLDIELDAQAFQMYFEKKFLEDNIVITCQTKLML